jgi:predicted ATPase
LIGPNGSGKSSLLQSIDFLKAFFLSSVEVYLQERGWEPDDIPNLRDRKKNIRWELTADLDTDQDGAGRGQYHYVIAFRPRKPLDVGQERLEYAAPGQAWVTLLDRNGHRCGWLDRQSGAFEQFKMIGLPASVMSQMDGVREKRAHPEMFRFRRWIEGFRSYLIWDPKVLRRLDRGRHPELGASGEHLAALVGRLKDEHPEGFGRLVRRLRRLFPNLSDLSVSGRGWGWREIRLHEGPEPEVVYNSRQMSDGVLRLLTITSLLYLENIPPLITLEEPENGVHPQLVREVIQILRELTQRRPPNRCQVFFTTHSPYVLDEFYDRPEQVYCVDRPRPLAGSTVTRLSDKREIRIARETFEHSLGEAWTSGLIGSTAGVRSP